VRSPGNGQFILRRPGDLLGKFARKGEILAFVASFDEPIVKIIVPEESADLVRARTDTVELRLADSVNVVRAGLVLRETPTFDDRLPSLALSTSGGGEVAVDPRDPKNPRALTRILHVELGFASPFVVREMGGRVYARFDHGNEPLAWRFYRELRQLFLRRFNV